MKLVGNGTVIAVGYYRTVAQIVHPEGIPPQAGLGRISRTTPGCLKRGEPCRIGRTHDVIRPPYAFRLEDE